MKLSGPELNRLKQRSRFRKTWRRLRWLCLFVAVASIAEGAWMLHKLADWPEMVVRFWPTAFVFTAVGSTCLGVTIITWRDDFATRLLAKLLAEQESQQQ
jgi:hypothetical protein